MQQLYKHHEAQMQRDATIKKIADDKIWKENVYNEEKTSDKRLIQRLQTEKDEREAYNNMVHQEQRKKMVDLQKEQEEKLARAIEKQKLDAIREEKLRQQLRQNSPELRELEAKLRMATITKERYKQLIEKQAFRERENEIAREVAEMMRIQKEEGDLKERRQMEIKLQEQINYQKDLDEQIEEQDDRQRKAYVEFLEEKILIDEIVRKVVEDDMLITAKKLEDQKRNWEFICEFQKMQEDFKIKEQQKMLKENEEIQKYLEVQDVRTQQQKEKLKMKAEALDKIKGELSEKLDEQLVAKEREELIRTELAIEEKEEAEKKLEREQIEKKIREKLEQQNIYSMQMWAHTQRIQREKEEEEEFRVKMMAKLAEDDKIDILTSQKRKLRQAEHRRAVHKMIEDNRAKKAAEKIREMDEYFHEQEMEKCRQMIIEDERQRLLRQHAIRLLGYLPKGVVKDEKDLKKLGKDFVDFYKKPPVEEDEY